MVDASCTVSWAGHNNNGANFGRCVYAPMPYV